MLFDFVSFDRYEVSTPYGDGLLLGQFSFSV
jgi:hypothetical protein